MIAISLISLLVLMFLGMPVSFAIGLSGFMGIYFGSDLPLHIVAQKIVSGLDSFPLMACPFFLLAGEMMGKGGLSTKIVRFSSALVGHLTGGLAMVNVVASMIFAGISGSAAADTSAIGSIMIPQMLERKYSRGFSASLIATAGAIGPIIPPSLSMIVYASVTGDSVGQMFLGGIVPGVLLGIFLMIMSYFYAKKNNLTSDHRAGIKELVESFKGAIWALIVPLIIVGGIITGVFTATEAGIIAVAYALVCGFFIYRELKVKDLWDVILNSASSTAMIMMIMGTASTYGYMIAAENIASSLGKMLLSISTNPTILTIIIVIIFLILGCFMEMLAVMVVVMPVVHPIMMKLGVDPIHFGVVVCVSTITGTLTPPVGMNLFISMGIAKAKMAEMFRYIYPMVGLMIILLTIMIFIPETVTFIPRLFFAK